MMFPWDHPVTHIATDISISAIIPDRNLIMMPHEPNHKYANLSAYHYDFGWWDFLQEEWVNQL